MTPPRTTRLAVDGRGLTLTLTHHDGPGDVPVLVLHGFLDHAGSWAACAAALGRRVVIPDQRGHGLSDHVGAGGFYHFWDYVADADAIVRHLGGTVDLIGHSMGGTVATLLAATRPEAVRRLVLIEGLGPPDLGADAHARAVAFLNARAQPPRHPSFPTVDDAARRMTDVDPRLDPQLARALAARVTRPVLAGDPAVRDPAAGGVTWTWDPLHRARNPVPFRADAHRAWLAAIRAPVLLVEGGDSGYRLPDHDARIGALADATCAVVDGAGHMVHRDQPDALAALLIPFLGA